MLRVCSTAGDSPAHILSLLLGPRQGQGKYVSRVIEEFLVLL